MGATQQVDQGAYLEQLRGGYSTQDAINVYYRAYPDQKDSLEKARIALGDDGLLDAIIEELRKKQEAEGFYEIAQEPQVSEADKAQQRKQARRKAGLEAFGTFPSGISAGREAGGRVYERVQQAWEDVIGAPGRKLGAEVTQPAMRKVRAKLAGSFDAEDIKTVLATGEVPDSMMTGISMLGITPENVSNPKIVLGEIAKAGYMPTADELGEEFIQGLIETKSGKKRDAFTKYLVGPNFNDGLLTNPYNSEVRRGEVGWRERVLARRAATAPVSTAIATAGQAIVEYPEKLIEHPDQLAKLTAQLAVGRFIVAPLAGKAIQTAIAKSPLAKRVLTMDFGEAFKRWLKFNNKKASAESVYEFFQNIQRPDVAKTVIVRGMPSDSPEVLYTLNRISDRLAGMSPEQARAFVDQFARPIRNGQFKVLVPRTLTAEAMPELAALPEMATVAQTTAGVPPVDVPARQVPAGLIEPPGIVTPAAEISTAAAVAPAIIPLDGSEVYRINARPVADMTGYTEDDVVFMRAMGMADDAIRARSLAELRPPEMQEIRSGALKADDTVLIPRYATTGKIIDDSKPNTFLIQMSNGMKLRMPRDDVVNAQYQDIPPSVVPFAQMPIMEVPDAPPPIIEPGTTFLPGRAMQSEVVEIPKPAEKPVEEVPIAEPPPATTPAEEVALEEEVITKIAPDGKLVKGTQADLDSSAQGLLPLNQRHPIGSTFEYTHPMFGKPVSDVVTGYRIDQYGNEYVIGDRGTRGVPNTVLQPSEIRTVAPTAKAVVQPTRAQLRRGIREVRKMTTDMARELGVEIPSDSPNAATSVPREQVISDTRKELTKLEKDIDKLVYDEGSEVYGLFGPRLDMAKIKAGGKKIVDLVSRKFYFPRTPLQVDMDSQIADLDAAYNKGAVMTEWQARKMRQLGVDRKYDEILSRYMDDPAKYKRDFDTLPVAVQQLVHLLQSEYAQFGAMAQKMGILDQLRENYIKHRWREKETAVNKAFGIRQGRLHDKPSFAKKRTFDTYADGEAAGLTPVFDPIGDFQKYAQEFWRTAADKRFIDHVKLLTDLDGNPMIMGEPKPPKPRGDAAAQKVVMDAYKERKAIFDRYVNLNIPSVNKLMAVGGVPAKVHPDVVRTLEEWFKPYLDIPKLEIGNKVFDPWNRYRRVRGFVRRIRVWNPTFHFGNIGSNNTVLGGEPFRFIVRGHKLWKKMDDAVLYAADSGLQIARNRVIASALGVRAVNNIRAAQVYANVEVAKGVKAKGRVILEEGIKGTYKDMRDAVQKATGAWGKMKAANEVIQPIRTWEYFNDKFLWDGIVRNSAIGAFDILTKHYGKRYPEMSREDVGKLIAHYVNDIYGLIPQYWMPKIAREAAYVALQFPNWTISNLDVMAKAATAGRMGFGARHIPPHLRNRLAWMNANFIGRMIFGAIMIFNIAQLVSIAVTNKLKKDGKLKGVLVPLHTTFQNGWKHWLDVDTGMRNSRGQPIYWISGFFRNPRDFRGWIADPAGTLANKSEVIARHSIEQIWNYTHWKKEPITQKGMPLGRRLEERLKAFTLAMSPLSAVYTEPGKTKTTIEYIAPFTGNWISKGAPGGRMVEIFYETKDKMKFAEEEVDNRIDVAIQKGKWNNAFGEMAKVGRYKTIDGVVGRIKKFVAPLNYMLQNATKEELAAYVGELKKHGYTVDDLKKAAVEEAMVLLGKHYLEAVNPPLPDDLELESGGREGTPGSKINVDFLQPQKYLERRE